MNNHESKEVSTTDGIKISDLPTELLLSFTMFLTLKEIFALARTDHFFHSLLQEEAWRKKFQFQLPHRFSAARMAMQEAMPTENYWSQALGIMLRSIESSARSQGFTMFKPKRPNAWFQTFKTHLTEEYAGLSPKTVKLICNALENEDANSQIGESTFDELKNWFIKSGNKNRNQSFLDFLFGYGKFVFKQGKNNFEFLQWAVLLNQITPLKEVLHLLNETELESLLFLTVQQGNTTILEMLFNLPIEVNYRFNTYGLSESGPLHMAAKYGYLEIASILLDKNADVDQTNTKNETPLFLATQNGHIDVVKLLLIHNANVNQVTDNNITPLFWPAKNGDVEIVKLLLEKNIALDQETVEQASEKVKPLLELECFLQGKSHFLQKSAISFWGNRNSSEETTTTPTDKQIEAAKALKEVILGADASILEKHKDTLHQSALCKIYHRCSEFLPSEQNSNLLGYFQGSFKSMFRH